MSVPLAIGLYTLLIVVFGSHVCACVACAAVASDNVQASHGLKSVAVLGFVGSLFVVVGCLPAFLLLLSQ